MRAFLMLYARDFENDDIDKDHHRYRSGKSRRSEWRAFTVLSSVCWCWHLTLTGWPDSPTGLWVRHKLRKMIECEYDLLFCQCQEAPSVLLHVPGSVPGTLSSMLVYLGLIFDIVYDSYLTWI